MHGTPSRSTPIIGRGSQVQRSPLGTPAFLHSPPPLVQGIPTPVLFALDGGQPGGRSIARSYTVASFGAEDPEAPEPHPPIAATVVTIARDLSQARRMRLGYLHWPRSGRRRGHYRFAGDRTSLLCVDRVCKHVRTASWVTAQTGFMGDGGRSVTSTILMALPIRSAS